MQVVLYRNTGVVAKLIRWQTRSEWSHASMVFSDGMLYEADFPGVRKYPYGRKANHDVFAVDVTPTQEAAMRAFAESQLGKQYDYSMVARFVTRQQEHRTDNGKWFCSELVFATFREGGIHLLDRIEPWAVSPELLGISPLLRAA